MVIMNKEFLTNKVAKILGVSATEKDFAFQIFLEKTAGVLEADDALKFPGLGFFYLKGDELPKGGMIETLLFVPLQKDSHLMDENFFLSFDVKKKKKSTAEFDPSVFSLSIDKATLPFEKDSERNPDISYQLLKKTIEERVEEIIAGALHLDHFKITDTIFSVNEEDEELTIEEERSVFETKDGGSYEEMVFNRMNFDDSGETVEGVKPEVINAETPDDITSTISDKVDDEENLHTSFYKDEEVKEETAEEKAEEKPEEAVIEEEVKVETVSALDDFVIAADNEKPKFEFFESKEEKENLDWSWSEKLSDDDEVKEEEVIKEFDAGTVLQIPVEKEQEADVPEEEDPFAELEKSFNADNEIVEALEEEVPVIEIEEKNDVLSNLQDVSLNNKEEQVEEKKEDTPIEESNPYEAEDSDMKRNLLVVGLVIVGLVAVYIIFFHGFGIIKKNAPQQPAASNQVVETKDSTQSGDKMPLEPAGKPEETKAGKADNSKVKATPKVEDKSLKLKEARAGDLLREIKNESRVGGNIYSDGSRFYVQVSSWKNVTKAEQEARKLKAKGLDAFVVKAYVEQFKSTWYRVRVGYFKTRQEAEAFEKKNK